MRLRDCGHSLRLCGTGSGEFEIAGAIVSADHVDCMGTDELPAWPPRRFRACGLLAVGITAVGCGIALQALDASMS